MQPKHLRWEVCSFVFFLWLLFQELIFFFLICKKIHIFLERTNFLLSFITCFSILHCKTKIKYPFKHQFSSLNTNTTFYSVNIVRKQRISTILILLLWVNMPAKTVVFQSLKKHDGRYFLYFFFPHDFFHYLFILIFREFRHLLPDEYIQMAGNTSVLSLS
jgi:hypothetical protein